MLWTVLIVLGIVAESYILGGIDTGILVSTLLYHDDVRTHGSGAAGMTNVLRTFGKKAAAMTACGDVCKGVLAVCIARWLSGYLPQTLGVEQTTASYFCVYLAAIMAIIGHSRPLLFGFKGGKGVLVAGGAILAVSPALIPFLFAIFLLCLLPTGMVSLGSITMAVCYPILTFLYCRLTGIRGASMAVCVIGSLIMGGMVVYMHRSNIQRIRAGKEYRFGKRHQK